MKKICAADIDCLNFWISYFGICYPNGYDEQEDISVSELMEAFYTEEAGSWWEDFTGYYDGVLDESDGYLDEPATLEEPLPGKTLKIEFHPGDILYFFNGEPIGSTGPHWKLKTIPYKELEQLLSLKNGRQLFLLLLPLAYIEGEDIQSVQKKIAELMEKYFPADLCGRVSKCITAGLA